MTITKLRLVAPGIIEQTTPNRTITPGEGRVLSFDPQGRGVRVEKEGEYIIVPWSSIASVYVEGASAQPDTSQPTPEPTSADERPSRASSRARKAPRTTPRS